MNADKEMSEDALDARAGPVEGTTGDIEQLVNLRQLSPNPVQLDQLPSRINSSGVSISRNTGDSERSEYTDGEKLKCLLLYTLQRALLESQTLLMTNNS